jgi:trans-aconitate methyltransferase
MNEQNISEQQAAKLYDATHCNNYSEQLKEYWNNCDPEFAHLTNDKWRPSNKDIRKGHRSRINTFLEFAGLTKNYLEGKTVIDYGIGDGLLGYVLLNKYKIGKYVGIDVSTRTLETAAKNLNKFKDKIVLQETPVDFYKFNASALISAACIQHFPTKEYLDDFAINILKAGIPNLMLYIRYSNIEKFEPNHPAIACTTNSLDMMLRLPGYTLKYESKPASNGYQYLILSSE